MRKGKCPGEETWTRLDNKNGWKGDIYSNKKEDVHT
jgi:hypothetical protein